MRGRLWLWLWLLPATLAAAQDRDLFLAAEASPTDVAIGETVTYQANATVRHGVTDSLQATPPYFRGFDLIGDPLQEETPAGETTRFTFTFRLRPRETGSLLIAPFVVRYTDATDGRQKEVSSGRVAVRVRPQAASEPGDIRPAKPPVAVPDALAPYRAAALYSGLAILASLALAGLARLVGRLRARPVAAPAPAAAVLPPHHFALQRLRDLGAERLPERGLLDEYHTRLSAIVREYLGERYGFYAPESTTSEIALRLWQHALPTPLLRLVREVLDGCDRVKFADDRPELEAARQLLLRAQALVEQCAAHGSAEAVRP